MPQGQHHLRFEFDGYHSLPVTVTLAESQDNFLRQPLALTRRSGNSQPPAPAHVPTAHLPRFTSDGAAPLAATEFLANYIGTANASSDRVAGWIYIDADAEKSAEFPGLSPEKIRDFQGVTVESNSPFLVFHDRPERTLLCGYQSAAVDAIAAQGARVTFSDVRQELDSGVWAQVIVEPPTNESSPD